MYTSYWKLHCRPFDSVSGEHFYFPGETHQATRAKLQYAIQHRVGAALVAGASGIGKSRLIQSLCDELPDQFGPVIHVRFPQMPPEELLAFIAEELTGRKSDPASVDQSLHHIQRALAKTVEQGRHTLLIIDEAHLLRETDALETVRLLINYEPSWTILLVGQPPLLPALERMPELEERLGVQCFLQPFDVQSTIAYMRHRVTAAGASDVLDLFEPAALEAIHRLSEGIPRKINRLGDLALLIGFAEEQPKITADHVHGVADELLAGPAMRQVAA